MRTESLSGFFCLKFYGNKNVMVKAWLRTEGYIFFNQRLALPYVQWLRWGFFGNVLFIYSLSSGKHFVKGRPGQCLGFELLSVRRGRQKVAVLQSRTSAVGAGDLWKWWGGEGMHLKYSELCRGWGNRLEQQLHVICRIMRLADKSQRKGNVDILSFSFVLWTAMEHFSLWEALEKALYRGYGHRQKSFSLPLASTMFFMHMTTVASPSLFSET